MTLTFVVEASSHEGYLISSQQFTLDHTGDLQHFLSLWHSIGEQRGPICSTEDLYEFSCLTSASAGTCPIHTIGKEEKKGKELKRPTSKKRKELKVMYLRQN